MLLISYMFNHCNKLKYLNLLNFTNNYSTDNMLTFQQKNKCEFISNNKNLLELYKTS